MRLLTLIVVAVISSSCDASPSAEQQSRPAADAPAAKSDAPRTNAEAAVLDDFRKRIESYVELHKQAAKGAPPLKETNDPGKIKDAQNGLATRIRAARSSAKAGDIFTPEIRKEFRRLLSPEMKGEDGRDAKKVLEDDAPAAVPLKVNAKYPEGASLPTVPATLLASLPKLPEELEYRIVGRNLILRDTEADIIVDYIPNVIA